MTEVIQDQYPQIGLNIHDISSRKPEVDWLL